MILSKVPKELQELRNRMNAVMNEISDLISDLNRESYRIQSSRSHTTWDGAPRGTCFERQERREKRALLSRLNAEYDDLRSKERAMMRESQAAA